MQKCNSDNVSPIPGIKGGGTYLFLLIIVNDSSIKKMQDFSVKLFFFYFLGYAKFCYIGLISDKCLKNCSF